MKFTINYRPTTIPHAFAEITVMTSGLTLISRASGATAPGHRIGTDEEGRDLYAAPDGWDALGTFDLTEDGWVSSPMEGMASPRHGHCLSAWLSRSLREAPTGIEQSEWIEALKEAAAQADRGKSGTIELEADVGELDAEDIERAARHAVELDRRIARWRGRAAASRSSAMRLAARASVQAEPHATGEPEWRPDAIADMLGVECVSEEAMASFEEAYRAEWRRTR